MNSKKVSVSYHPGIRRTENPTIYQIKSGGQTFKIISNNKIEPSKTIVKDIPKKEIEEEHIFVVSCDV